MCILITTTRHPDYKLIALSNRDEFLSRPTELAKWRTGDILSPCDLARPEHGTWIGVTRSGRFTCLLNFHEKNPANAVGAISRGLFTKDFLKSDLAPQQWVQQTKEAYDLSCTGGFTMVCGSLAGETPEVALLSNHESRLPEEGGTWAISNSLIQEPWPKAIKGKKLLDKLMDNASEYSEDGIVEEGFKILSVDTYPRDVENGSNGVPDGSERAGRAGQNMHLLDYVRETILVPRLDVNCEMGHGYGTRTQTVVLVRNDGSVRYIEWDIQSREKHEYEFLIQGTDHSEDI